MTAAQLRGLALSMPGAHEEPHFHRTSFRIGKRIFATMTRDGDEVMVPVHPLKRCFALLKSKPEVFFSYGTWTERNGAIGIRLAKAEKKLLRSLVRDAWARLAAKSLRPGK